MQLSARVEKDNLVFENIENFSTSAVNKTGYSSLKVLNKTQPDWTAQDEIFESEPVRETNLALFIKGFQAVVNTEIQKTLDCITLIEQNISSYSAEWRMLMQQLGDEGTTNERVRIEAKIATNKKETAEAQEQVEVLQQRILVLEEQLHQLDSQREWV